MLFFLWETERRPVWKTNATFWLYKCDCWNIVWLRKDQVKNWHTKSCGCKYRTAWWEWRTRFYNIWKWLNNRCYNKNSNWFEYYWWKWIKCKWESFQEFKEDMFESYLEHISEYWEKNTTIDRIDSDWDYCKENCKRATYVEQCNHLKNQKRYMRKWKSLLLKEIYESESIPVSYRVFVNRVCWYWWTVEQAVTVPKNKKP